MSESQAASLKPPGRKSVTILTPPGPTGGTTSLPVTSCSQEQLAHHVQPQRKVSFSDVVVTSRQVSVENVVDAINTNGPAGSRTGVALHEHVTLVDRSSEIPIDDSGHHITVDLVADDLEDDITLTNPSLSSTSLPVYLVRLGMLKQATLYQIEFTVPDSLPAGAVELLRFVEEGPGQVGAPVNVGATVELVECTNTPEPNHGHNLVLRLATTKQTEVNEVFTMRLVDRPSDGVHLVLHGLSMRRGQGTPFLRIGIHRISENPEYTDSDEFTEWPGFVNINEDEEEAVATTAGVDGGAGPAGNPALQQLQGSCDAADSSQATLAMLVDGNAVGQADREARPIASAAQGDKAAEDSRMDEH